MVTETPIPVLLQKNRNSPVGKFALIVDRHEVPYVEVVMYPVDADGVQVYPAEGEEHDDVSYRWDLSLDNRFSYTFDTSEEIERIAPLLANAMAVAAGWTAHGVGCRINRHGPAEITSA